jgi:hypothetical protein
MMLQLQQKKNIHFLFSNNVVTSNNFGPVCQCICAHQLCKEIIIGIFNYSYLITKQLYRSWVLQYFFAISF